MGPGELRDPIALAVLAGRVVIWDLDRQKTFTVLNASGVHVETIRPSVSGDWAPNMTRPGSLRWDSPFQMPDEDLSQRLVAFDSVSFVHWLESTDGESTHSAERLTRSMHLIHHINAYRADTIATLPSGALIRQTRPGRGRLAFEDVWLVGRPLFARGDFWYAVAHGDSLAIRVVPDADTVHAYRIILGTERPKPSRATKQRWADNVVRQHLASRRLIKSSEKVTASRKNRFRKYLIGRIPERTGMIAAMHGAGRCLWINAFDPTREVLGSASRWMGIDVYNRSLIGVFELPQGRVKDVDRYAFYVLMRDEDLTDYVLRYPFPRAVRCGEPARP
jgi:hypothetical protein